MRIETTNSCFSLSKKLSLTRPSFRKRIATFLVSFCFLISQRYLHWGKKKTFMNQGSIMSFQTSRTGQEKSFMIPLIFGSKPNFYSFICSLDTLPRNKDWLCSIVLHFTTSRRGPAWNSRCPASRQCFETHTKVLHNKVMQLYIYDVVLNHLTA